jgi:aryl-alcohol dehydrogenase-like predicted oxidoreductase
MRYKLLGHSGLRVSELCLGTMTFGDDWGWGAHRDESRKMFDAFVEAGGNFIDTACNYTDGTSEKFVGEFVGQNRDRFVVATKYTLSMRKDDPNGGGNSRKNMMQTVEGSLKRLGTEYLDLLWLHMYDGTTPIEEIMRGLDDLVRMGKVNYIGVSDSPSWVIAKANTIADLRGWSRFVALQVPYSLAVRDVERELLPMARYFDMAVTPFAIIGGGSLTGKYDVTSSDPKRYDTVEEKRRVLGSKIREFAEGMGGSAAQVAINWVRQQQEKSQIIPILGARSEKQLEENLGCLDFELTPEQLSELEALSGFDVGFPQTFLNNEVVLDLIHGKTHELLDNHRI